MALFVKSPFLDGRVSNGLEPCHWSNCDLCLMADVLAGSYEHHNIEEPAILLGGAFMVDVVENVEEKKS